MIRKLLVLLNSGSFFNNICCEQLSENTFETALARCEKRRLEIIMIIMKGAADFSLVTAK